MQGLLPDIVFLLKTTGTASTPCIILLVLLYIRLYIIQIVINSLHILPIPLA